MSSITPRLALLLFSLVCVADSAVGQMTSRPVRDGSLPSGAGAGSVSTDSRGVKSGSVPVTGDGTLRELSPDRLGGESVRGSITGDLRSGPVSDASVGAVRDRPPPAMIAPPIPSDYFPSSEDEPIQESDVSPVFDLQSLAERVRAVQPLPRTEPPTDEPLEASDSQDGRVDSSENPDETEIADEESEPADAFGDADEGSDEAGEDSVEESPAAADESEADESESDEPEVDEEPLESGEVESAEPAESDAPRVRTEAIE